MLQFRLGKIPVEVHWSHLVLALVLASEAGRTPASVLMWGLVVSFSILFHELGHAAAALAFGYRPSIQLAWLGGNTRPNAESPVPWHREVVLTLAGPGFGFLLAAIAWLLARRLPHAGPLTGMLEGLALTNITWSIFNLVPILPLDGGRVLSAVLTRVAGANGTIWAWATSGFLSSLVASMGLWLALSRGRGWAAWTVMMFAMFAMQAFRVTHALWQSRATTVPPELLEARAAYERGDLDGARRAASGVAEGPTTPAVRSRAEHLLGWIALKQGEGRRALDHFSQVSGRRVEPEALAAAFSLLGDDPRALPLWELAYRQSAGPTVLHEWAGTLIRLGRPQDAARLPGVDTTAALTCAERVLFLRGAYREAAEVGQHAFERAPSASRAYDVACAWARARCPEEALSWLKRASELGFTDIEHADTDADLATLHGRPGFEAWKGSLRKSPLP